MNRPVKKNVSKCTSDGEGQAMLLNKNRSKASFMITVFNKSEIRPVLPKC